MAEQLSPTENALADLKKFHSNGFLVNLSERNIYAVADPQPVGILGSEQHEPEVELERLRETFMELPEEAIVNLAERASVELTDDAIDHTGRDPEEVKRIWAERRFNHRFIFTFLSEEQKAKLQ